MKLSKYFFAFFLLIPFLGFSQTRVCLATQYQEQLNQSAKYQLQKSVRNFEREFKNVVIRNSKGNCNNIVKLPIAVHYFNLDESLHDCAIEAAIKQVEILNEDFKGTNIDVANWGKVKDKFPDIKTKSPCFAFEIASRNHPFDSKLKDGDLAVVFHNRAFENYNAYWTNYINLYIGQIPNGVLGYSPLGGWGNGDGVALGMDFIGIGSIDCGRIGSDANYNLGRTATHEVGHYLLLDHIWGEGCNKDDGVADTPNSEQPYGGCPGSGSSCGSLDLHMNYMDYTLDKCMYMFTSGQIDWMDEYVYSDLDNVIEKGKKVLSQTYEVPIQEPLPLVVTDTKNYTLKESVFLIYPTYDEVKCNSKSRLIHIANLLDIDVSEKENKKYYANAIWKYIRLGL